MEKSLKMAMSLNIIVTSKSVSTYTKFGKTLIYLFPVGSGKASRISTLTTCVTFRDTILKEVGILLNLQVIFSIKYTKIHK